MRSSDDLGPCGGGLLSHSQTLEIRRLHLNLQHKISCKFDIGSPRVLNFLRTLGLPGSLHFSPARHLGGTCTNGATSCYPAAGGSLKRQSVYWPPGVGFTY